MTECWTATVTTKRRLDAPKWLSAEQIAFMLLDELWASAQKGGEGALADGDGAQILTGMLSPKSAIDALKAEVAKGTKKKPAKPLTDAQISEALDKGIAKLAKDLSWENPHFVSGLKNGTLAKVESCVFPGRVVLGSCSLSGAAEEGSWGFEQRHYSVAATIDSDAALKRCARMGGKWSAPDPDSPQVASARLKEHANKLRQAADPERLEQQMKRLQNMVNGN